MKVTFPDNYRRDNDLVETLRILHETSKRQGEDLKVWLGNDYYCIGKGDNIEAFLTHIMSGR